MRISESDMLLVPDLSTFAVIPWESNAHHGRVYLRCAYHHGHLSSARRAMHWPASWRKPRRWDSSTASRSSSLSFRHGSTGNPVPDVTHDEAGYFDATADRGTLVRNDMITALEAFGIEVEAGHHEGAAGQHEIDFRYGNAIKTADNAVTFKYVFKAIARQHGLYATFMPKPIIGINGSGMHVHQSLAR